MVRRGNDVSISIKLQYGLLEAAQTLNIGASATDEVAEHLNFVNKKNYTNIFTDKISSITFTLQYATRSGLTVGLYFSFNVTSQISNWTTIFKFTESELIPGTASIMYGYGADGVRLLQIGNNYVRTFGNFPVGSVNYSFCATYIK